MDHLLIIAAIVLFVFQSTALKKIRISSLGQNLLITGAFSAMIALALGIWAMAVRPSISGYTIGYGIAFGLVFILTLAVYHFAMQMGPLSYTAFFFAASMLIPALAGLVFWDEPFTWAVGTGILLFLTAFWLITVFGGEKGKKGNGRWLLLCALTWAGNGSLAILMNLQGQALESAEKAAEPIQLMFVSFLTAAAIALAAWAILNRRQLKTDAALLKAGWLPVLLVGIGTGAGNVLVSYLTGRVPSSYLFPLVQGGTMVAVTLYSALVLKEKISRFGLMGIGAGVAAIVAMNL